MIILGNREFARKDYELFRDEESKELLRKERSKIAQELLKKKKEIIDSYRLETDPNKNRWQQNELNNAQIDARGRANDIKNDILDKENNRHEKYYKQCEINRNNTKTALKRVYRMKGKKLLKRGGITLLGLSALGSGNYLYKKKTRNFSESNNTKDNSKKIGLGLSGIGAITLANLDKSKLNGRVNLYHGTSRDAGRKILKEGLKGSHALDSENLTNTCLDGAGKKDGRKLVYTAKRKFIADTMSGNQFKLGNGKFGRTLKLSIPYDEYKNMKRVYDNPEFEGAKNYKEFFENNVKKGNFKNNIGHKLNAKFYWDSFSGAKGTKGTRIFEQDIDSSKIKGSKNYVKNSFKEWSKYVKNNPKRFGKETTKVAIGVGLLGAGVSKLNKSKKDDSTKK